MNGGCVMKKIKGKYNIIAGCLFIFFAFISCFFIIADSIWHIPYFISSIIISCSLFARKNKLCILGFSVIALFDIREIIYFIWEIHHNAYSIADFLYFCDFFALLSYIANLCMLFFIIMSEKNKFKAKKFIWAVPPALLFISYLRLLADITSNDIMYLLYSVIHIFAFVFTSAYMKNKEPAETQS